jgi:enoyl-CoA hydratase
MTKQPAVLVDLRGKVGVLRLNRPDVRNAINAQLIDELDAGLQAMNAERGVGCVVITGSDQAFAAGADIKEMRERDYVGSYLDDFLARWDQVARFRKPLIAAVSGYALGGGCELALTCDVLIASETAQFGQPEIKLGVPPGAGGTQRLTRAIGKAKAMDLCLTGRMMGVEEAERAGLVSRIVPAAALMDEALKVAETIAAMSLPIAMMVKESVNRSFESTLSEGLRTERQLFYSAFATEDQKEGMTAFLEKRAPHFRNR